MLRRRKMLLPVLSAGLLLVVVSAAPAAADPSSWSGHGGRAPTINGFKNVVVIYEENHSFDNLYGSWGPVNGEPVTGLADARQVNTTQITQDGDAYGCLLQDDVNLSSPSPVPTTCVDQAHHVPASGFANTHFTIDDFIRPKDKTCPAPGTSAPNGVLKGSDGATRGGCTRDLVHRFYQEQYQLNGGRQNRYVTGSDAVGLTMGVYDTTTLPIYQYLHRRGAPNYVIADHFFQAAFGGSFLNHQYLVAARAPVDTDPTHTGGAANLHSVVDGAGFPNSSYPLYTPTAGASVKDAQLTQACPSALPNLACGDYAVNTMQPTSPPFGGGSKLPLIDDAVYPNIGDRLTEAKISWNWYSGGWSDADAGHPGPLFQYHHQPLNYFAAYAPGQPGRSHLRDETEFIQAARRGQLPTVSFVKPYGAENDHPGYASEPDGSDHLVDLIKAITSGPQARDTLIVVTYDEFGGQWDHVSPPGLGNTDGPSDQFGPGTRIPALLISTGFHRSGVDHHSYHTTSIMATLEHALNLPPVATRDAQVADLTAAIRTGTRH